MKHFTVTPAMGKRLIAKAVAARDDVKAVLRKGTLVIVAGTTNGYVAEEILDLVASRGEFSRKGFRRGVVVPKAVESSQPSPEFPGDVVLVDGQWSKGKEIFDVIDDMKAGDMVIKGANALDLDRGRAAVLVGHPMCGTAGALLPAVVGRRVKLLVPVGVEKRVSEDLSALALLLSQPDATGPRLLPLPGEVITELDAIAALTGATPRLIAGGGVHGAEGAAWILVTGQPQQVQAAEQLNISVADEGLCDA